MAKHFHYHYQALRYAKNQRAQGKRATVYRTKKGWSVSVNK